MFLQHSFEFPNVPVFRYRLRDEQRSHKGQSPFNPDDAIGGAPFIYVTFNGEHIPIQLDMRKLDREPNRRSGYRIYGKWRIPDRPEIPKRLRGAIGRIRHNSTEDEIATSRRRTRALRPIHQELTNSIDCSAFAKTPSRCTTISNHISSTVVHELSDCIASN
jgi:hypothetical protein